MVLTAMNTVETRKTLEACSQLVVLPLTSGLKSPFFLSGIALVTADGSEDDCTGELVGAVAATFFLTVLVYTVVLVTVKAVMLKLKRNR